MSYNNFGKIRQKIEGIAGEAKTYDYTYDVNGQLTQVMQNGAVVEVYAYDANGNRTGHTLGATAAETAFYDAQDRLTKRGDIKRFDADGFHTWRGGDAFQYSATGELLKPILSDGTVIEYTYDGTGRRVARTINGQTGQYLYGNLGDPFQVTATREPDGTLTSYYYDGFRRLFAFERGSAHYYVACDQVGTPKVVADAAGSVVKVLEYDSFGCLESDSNPAFYLPIGFADPDTGLIRFGFRDYNPEAGRWTARDPIFFAGGQGNLYAYCGSDPVNWRDLSGKIAIADDALIGGIVVIGGLVATYLETSDGQQLLNDLMTEFARKTGKGSSTDVPEYAKCHPP